MKRKVTLLTIALLVIFSVNAQTKKINVSAGMTLVPQASMNLNKPSDGFSPFFNLFPQVTVSKNKWFGVGFYSIAFNSFGSAIGFNPTSHLTTYLVGLKSTMKNDGYIGLGIGTPVAENRATAFVEFGSSIQKPEPVIYIGMFIPFSVPLN